MALGFFCFFFFFSFFGFKSLAIVLKFEHFFLEFMLEKTKKFQFFCHQCLPKTK